MTLEISVYQWICWAWFYGEAHHSLLRRSRGPTQSPSSPLFLKKYYGAWIFICYYIYMWQEVNLRVLCQRIGLLNEIHMSCYKIKRCIQYWKIIINFFLQQNRNKLSCTTIYRGPILSNLQSEIIVHNLYYAITVCAKKLWAGGSTFFLASTCLWKITCRPSFVKKYIRACMPNSTSVVAQRRRNSMLCRCVEATTTSVFSEQTHSASPHVRDAQSEARDRSLDLQRFP